MVIVYFLISVILMALILFARTKLAERDNIIIPEIRELYAMAVITMLFYSIAAISGNELLAVFMHGAYFAATDWLVISLFKFVVKYSNSNQDFQAVKIVIYVGAAIDTISMFVNIWTHHVFECTWMPVYKGGTSYFYGIERGPAYIYHLIFVYCAAAFVLLFLIIKTVTSISMYRRKYSAVMLSYLIILIINFGYRFTSISMDISPACYGILALAIGYFSLFYVPSELVEKLLAFSIQDLEDGIICYDMDERCVYANDTIRKLYGVGGNIEKLEINFSKWKDEHGINGIKEKVWQEKIISDGEEQIYEFRYRHLFDQKGFYIGFYVSACNRTEEIKRYEIQRYRATHDPLTKIYNREGFVEGVKYILDNEPKKQYYILCADIKDFKLINDLFGTKKGDEILIKMAEIMKINASADTVYGRLSADKFAMCIAEENYQERKFRKYISEIEDLGSNNVYRMHIHMGVYRITDPKIEVSVMCDRAFMAISNIKDSYQDVIAFYDDNIGNALLRHNTMLGEFDKAIEEKQFCMFLQPQISAESGKLLGAEALVRWRHPKNGMVPPGEFIPTFEETGLIHRLDKYIWELACQKLLYWKNIGREDLHISVNISPKDFYYLNIYETLKSLVEKYGIDPSRLKLEITETAIMTNLQNQLSVLERLRKYGFQIEIDDFGSGYSSLNTLKDINVDVLKLDMGFLSETSYNERSQTIMNAVIAMSKQLNLTTVAEGVETEAQVIYLTGIGCDIFQGYHFSRPLPSDEFEVKYSIG